MVTHELRPSNQIETHELRTSYQMVTYELRTIYQMVTHQHRAQNSSSTSFINVPITLPPPLIFSSTTNLILSVLKIFSPFSRSYVPSSIHLYFPFHIT